MIKFVIKNLLCITICLVIGRVEAQDKCKDALYEANKLFESGNLKECIDRLEPCLSSQKQKEERTESCHLLAQAYQNLNDLKNAEKYIRKMLLLKPDYQKFPNIDPMDFSRLVNQYSVTPKFFLGAKVGFNRNSVALDKSYSAYSSSQSYNPVIGYQYGIMADYRLKPSLSIYADLFLSGIGINHIIDSAGGWQQNYTEQQGYWMLNLGAAKYFKLGKQLQVFTGLGLGMGYLRKTNVFMESTNLETNSLQQATQNPIDSRNRLQTNINGTVGVSYPVPPGMLGLEAGFFYFFKNTVNPDKRMDDLNFIFNNQYVNDDVSLRTMTINISYKLPLVWRVGLKK